MIKSLILLLSFILASPSEGMAATKKVCKVFGKTTKCRTVKIHKKHIGTPVPKKIKK